jgi:hypothetical protein
MPQIVLIEKLYHEQRGKPSSIGNAGGSPTGGWVVPINNGGNGLFGDGGNKPLGGGDNGLPRSGGNEPSGYQNLKPYVYKTSMAMDMVYLES